MYRTPVTTRSTRGFAADVVVASTRSSFGLAEVRHNLIAAAGKIAQVPMFAAQIAGVTLADNAGRLLDFVRMLIERGPPDAPAWIGLPASEPPATAPDRKSVV